MRTGSALTQLLSAHSLKHPSGLSVSLLEKIIGIQFLLFTFLSFSFIKENWQPRAVGNLPCDTIKSNTLIYPKDSFRSNFMINRYQIFSLDSFSDLMVYFNEPGVPGRENTLSSRVDVWKVMHLCIQVLVLAKLEAQVFVGKSWKTDQFWPVQGWIPLPFGFLLWSRTLFHMSPPPCSIVQTRLFTFVCVPTSPTLLGLHKLSVLCEALLRPFRVKRWWGLLSCYGITPSKTVCLALWGFQQDFDRKLLCFLAHRPWEHMAKTLCKHIG